MSERDQKVYSISDMDAYRDGLNSIHAEEVATLRAQLLAARAEAFEECAKDAEQEANACHIAASQAISRGAMATFELCQTRARTLTNFAAALRERGADRRQTKRELGAPLAGHPEWVIPAQPDGEPTA